MGRARRHGVYTQFVLDGGRGPLSGQWVDPRSPVGLQWVLSRLNLAPSQRWGQNFLIDREIFEAMVNLLNCDSVPAQVLEIGPGVGGLTLTLLEHGASVIGIEIDQRVKPVLDHLARRFPAQLTTLYQDALSISWADALRQVGWESANVVGNVPYYLTAPLLGRLLVLDFPWHRAVFMVQREVAQRLLTDPGHRNTSALSVLLRYKMDVREGIPLIAPDRFSPRPEVQSAVIQLIRHPNLAVDWHAYRRIVRAGFQHRRKTLRKCLSAVWSEIAWPDVLSALNIASRARAEELTLDQWTRLAAALKEAEEQSLR